MTRRSGTLAVWLAVLAAAAGPASAQEGVFVDPDSPSGREYALPLESARRQADPNTPTGTKVQPGVRDASPLFGAGISGATGGQEPPSAGDGPAEEPGSGSGRGSGGAASGDGSGAGSPGTQGGDDEPGQERTVRAALQNPGSPGGGGSTMGIVGGAALVLIAGAGAGLLLRRRSGG